MGNRRDEEGKDPKESGDKGIRGIIRGTGTFIHSLYTNKHNLFPQELLSKCSLS